MVSYQIIPNLLIHCYAKSHLVNSILVRQEGPCISTQIIITEIFAMHIFLEELPPVVNRTKILVIIINLLIIVLIIIILTIVVTLHVLPFPYVV